MKWNGRLPQTGSFRLETPCVMDNKELEKTPKAPKTFLTVGPTLHYSHRNVQFYWLLAAFVFALACLF